MAKIYHFWMGVPYGTLTLHTCYIIYWYVLYNFWKCLFVKIAGRVLGPDHIVTSLERLDTVPGVQA